MKTIKWLLGLTARNQLIAGMMIVILYLVTRGEVKEYRYDKERAASEKEKYERARLRDSMDVKLWNRVIEQQTVKADLLDSSIKKSDSAIKKALTK